MKKNGWLVVLGALLVISVLLWQVWQGLVVGKGYLIWGLGERSGIELAKPELLAQAVQLGREAGGVMGTVVLVKKGVDVRAEYAISVTSKEKQGTKMAGCLEPHKILGLLSVVEIVVDPDWIEKEFGKEVGKERLNALILSCWGYGMVGGSTEGVWQQVRQVMVEPMVRQAIFGMRRE